MKIEQGKQEEFRVEVKRLLKRDQNNKKKANVSKEELQAMKELKLDTQQADPDSGQGGCLSSIR